MNIRKVEKSINDNRKKKFKNHPKGFNKSVNSFILRVSIFIIFIFPFTGCELGVENPGPISDDALNVEGAMEPLVVGMASDLSAVLDDVSYFMGIASRDIYHSGVFEAEQFMQNGNIEPRHVNELWADMHTARWTAESGIERMQEVLGSDFESNSLAIRAYLWVGYSNRVLGENVCQAVIDGGEAQPNTVHFERAESAFTEAITLASQQGETELLQRAYAGRAQVRLALQDWEGAESDAQNVTGDFEFEAAYSLNSTREENWLSNQSNVRSYFSVYGTFAVDQVADPRITWIDQNEAGSDGETPFYLQRKYLDNGSNIELAKWDEMLLIEAEVALRSDDVPGAMQKINEERSRHGLGSLSASNEEEAWQILRTERNIILWMEGRHLWDLRRFDDPFLSDRDRCIPPSQNEVSTNDNLN